MMKRICAPLVAAFAMFVAGCAAMPAMPAYVDPALGDLKPADRVEVTEKRPVQLVFAFLTNGSKNASATNLYAVRATELVNASGMFSQVSSSPVPGGAVLSITINHVAENTVAKGLMAGLTFGLTGPATLSDFYVATATYTPGPANATITVERKHAIHSPTDAEDVPEGVTPSKSFESALDTVTRQLFEHTLNEIAKDPSFKSSRSQQASATGQS
jgi:hypothetical protein